MKKFLLACIVILCTLNVRAQTMMNIHQNGNVTSVPVSIIDSVVWDSLYLNVYENNSSVLNFLLPIDSITYTLGWTAATLTTNQITNIDSTSATSGGNITNDGGSPINDRGVCFSINPNPTLLDSVVHSGIGTGNFVSNMTGLISSTIYYVRSFATNDSGITYGNQLVFVTPPIFASSPGVTDIDGNFYPTIMLNTQEWMASNLTTTRYANGDTIDNIQGDTAWSLLTTGAWSYYNNDSTYNLPYGKLYNGYTITDPRNVCPSGWHVPSSSEWDTLIAYISLYSQAIGGQLKDTTTTYWQSPNMGATNSSGFTALPGGIRRWNGIFDSMGSYATFWSSTLNGTDLDWLRMFYYDGSALKSQDNVQLGYSVRCIKD